MATFYLSSTFDDLQECREAVARTLRRLGHQVEGMENYGADGRAPLQKCLEDVAKCHAYVGIFAWRYGYVPEKGNRQKRSITELEYREALRLKREPLIFILHEDASWQGSRYDEDRKRVRSLREALSKAHTVSFFKDCNDLAAQVSTAVATRFPRVGEDEPTLPLTKPTPKPTLWKWYAVAAAAVVVLFFLGYRIKSAYWPAEVAQPRPAEWVSDWASRFNKSEKLEEHWDYPKDVWTLEPGELAEAGKDVDDQALLVRGPEMGVPKDLGGRVFCNFRATFEVRFKNGGERAAWVLRAQADKAGGYLFELVREGADLYLYGWVYDGKKKTETLGTKQRIPFGPLRETKSLYIDVEVKDNGFAYEITFEDDEPDENSNAGQQVRAEFKDDPAKVRWPCGVIGFLVTDDASVMRVEYVYVYPHPLPQTQ